MELKKKSLTDKTIHFWYCDFNQNKNRLDSFHSILSTDERARSGKFKFEKDRDCYIISRGILRLLLGSYLDMKAKDIKFKYTSYGKPILDFESNLKFNVSHSGNRAAFAFFRNTEIGVDIEKIKYDFDVLELAQNFFSKKEIEVLERQSEENLPAAFFRCWTRKESFIKAEGSGLSFPLDKFAVSLENDEEAKLLETQWNLKEKVEWNLFSFKPASDYIAAVAVRNHVTKISYYDWDELSS
ncbi:4'-phosphopantetheinyl transferase superfamily protein [Maribacter algarum]|nr:4'-phosphopantetheinyl transferase superfamily protein [Maribacter algarum]